MNLLVYDRVIEQLTAVCRSVDPPLPVAKLFPEPEGLDAFRQRLEEAGKTEAEKNEPGAPSIRK